MGEVLKPGAALLSKLASIVVHADEFLSDDGHQIDRDALAGLLKDPEVTAWIGEMTDLALAPVMRKPEASRS